MTRALRFCLLLAPVILACASQPVRRAPAPRDEGPCECERMSGLAATRFGFHAASHEPAEGLDLLLHNEERQPVHVSSEPAVSLSHFESARVFTDPGLGEIVLHPALTTEGAQAMRELTESRIGERIALVLDGDLVMDLRVVAPMSQCIQIVGLSEEQACRVACAVRERTNE